MTTQSALAGRARPVRPGSIGRGPKVRNAVLAATLVLWMHYGPSVFFEMVAAGIAACF